MTVVWTVVAIHDLRHIYHFIAETKPQAAAAIAQRLIDAAERLSDFPASGRAGRLPDTRELVVTGTPFIMPYRVIHAEIQIVAVMHAARRWPDD